MKQINNIVALSLAIFCVLSVFFSVTHATYGVDVSQQTLIPAWKCLAQNGYSFGIIRAYESVGRPDPNGPHTVYNAWSGGMSHVDVYMFPCPTCSKSASAQVSEAVNYLRNYDAKYGMFWFDIEGPQYWKDQSYNRNWLTEAINEARNLGQTIGIYTSESQWSPIMGSWTGGSAYPLWYAHYDGSPSFSDFRPFGGWSSPAIKQYAGDASICGAGVDKNWY